MGIITNWLKKVNAKKTGFTPCYTTMHINIIVLHIICYLHNTVAQKIVV